MSNDSIYSSYREKLLEHLLLGELLKHSWTSGNFIEVSRPEADRSGYDVILEVNGLIRHVQFKTRKKTGKARKQKVHIGLERKPSGCVIVIFFDEELNLGPFLFLGGEPGKSLPSLKEFLVARHTKPNSERVKAGRPDLRDVGHSKFKTIESIAGLVTIWAMICGTHHQRRTDRDTGPVRMRRLRPTSPTVVLKGL